MRLVSFYGNEVVITDDKRKIEWLKSQGFKEQEPIKKELPKKEGANENAKRKSKNNAKGNIR